MIVKPHAVFPFTRALNGAAIALALLASSMTAGAADSPFTNLGGSWSGPGVITLNTGAKERIRCRATYDVDRSGDNLSITIRCASDSYKFNLQGSITHANGAVTGVWSESVHGVGGTIVGRGAPGRIQVRAEGTVVNALLALTTRDNRQSVSISSPGSPLSQVAISMSRGR
jgi:hypothetical protein